MHLIFFFGTVVVAALPSPSPSPLPEITHVYTSDRSDETLRDAARTTYVITRDQIARNGYRTVAEAVESIPGIELSPYGAIGAGTQYGIRGSSSAQILVLIDGLPAPGSLSNSVEIGTMPTLGVDRIEIVEGGGSTLFGTGAIGGIINVITGRPARTSATARLGSFADRELQIETPSVQFSRIAARNDFGLPDGSTRDDSDYAAGTLRANMRWSMGSIDASARAGIVADHLGVPGPVEFLSPSSREDDLNENVDLTLTRRGPQSQGTLQFGASAQRITFLCDATNDANCFQDTPSLNTEGRVEFGARNVVEGAKERLLYGIDLSRGSVRSDAGGTFTYDALAQSAAYVQESFDQPSGRIYVGLRGERDGALGGELSPSVGAIERLSPALVVKANVATAFRAPNSSELYFPFYGNPKLRPERAAVADFSLVSSGRFGTAAIGWFANRTNDLIVPVLIDPVHFVFAPENIDHASIAGLTFDLRTNPAAGWSAVANLTDLYRAEDLDAQTRLPDDPVFTANAGVDYAGHGFVQSFGVRGRFAGRRGTIDPTMPTFSQPVAYGTIDAYVRLGVSRDLTLTLRGYNLGNQRYAAVNGYPMPGSAFAVELSTP